MSNAFKLSKYEMKKLFGNRFLRLAILVVSIVPLLYGVLYLWAFWNPYGQLNNVPVAVVNEDSGAISNDKLVNFGDNLTQNLKSNQVLKWDFVSDANAQEGLKSHKYYAEIKIPNDFSTKITSVSGPTPESANIIFVAREANSLIGSQLTNRVASQISENLSDEISKNYYENIFTRMRTSAEGVSKAADGSNQLSQGLVTAKNGSSSLSNGADSAYSGSLSLVTGINKLLLGSKDLNAGINQSLIGAKTLDSGITESASGAKSLSSGASNLQNGIAQVSSGVNTLLFNLNSTTQNLTLAQSYFADPNTVIDDSSSPFNGMKKLQAANYIVSTIVSDANSSVNQQQITSLQSGLNQISSGSQSLSQGATDLSNALNNQIKPGSGALVTSLTKLSDGSNALEAGIDSAYSGSKNLSGGLAEITSGTKDLSSGISNAQTGAEELGKQLSTGAEEALKSVNISLTDKLSLMMSNPVQMKDKSIAKVSNYGTGFAPYFIPLSLWVGSLVLFLVISLKKDEEKKTPPRDYYFSKFVTLAKIGTTQAVVLDLVLILALGLRPLHYIAFFLFSILISLCFLAILELLVAAFQDAGKFVGIVLLMLQLTSASGTYPIQTAPGFFRAINPYLPMTYAVKGLREIISGGNISNIWIASTVLLLFTTVFLGLIILLSKKIKNSSINFSV